MSTERQKMLAGEGYDPAEPELVAARTRARALCHALNQSHPADHATRRRLLCDLLGSGGDTVTLEPPFHCDYGTNIHLGAQVYFNFQCILLDVCEVRIGDRTLFGPGVQIYTPLHPMTVAERRAEWEYGQPVAIGADVWVGGGALILPGVRIGDGAVIGAGSVVTQEVPAGVLAAGNPCRIIREIERA